MGAELFDAFPELLGEVSDDILGWSLRDVCLDGPEEELTRTEHAQPALFAISYALWLSFREAYDGPIAAGAGHSLGEYTALCAAGVLGYEDALKVVGKRGEAMARAAQLEPSGMAALIGADASLAEEVSADRRAQGGRLEVANINAPGQVVLAGSAEDIAWVTENARELGVRRAVLLKVAGAFHSEFMAPASEEVGAVLETVRFAEPEFPVWSNTTAAPHQTSDIAEALRSQVTSTVRFSESLEQMSAIGVDTFVHVGPGDVTAGMAKRTVEGSTVHVVSELSDIPSVVDSIVNVMTQEPS